MLASALLLVASAAGEQWEQKVDEDGRAVQSMQIQAPSMTEEDQYGYTMPDQYRCDACKVVAHHLGEALKQRQPKNRRLQEWEYTDIFDETCKKALSGYGITVVDGQNVLSGPALKRNELQSGTGAVAMGAIQFGGETWEKRLGEICRKFVYEKIGEDELYEHFRKQGELSSDLCFQETRDCQLGPESPPKKDNAEGSSSTKKEKKRKQAKSDAESGSSNTASIDLSTFIGKLAKKHGIAKAEYSRKRSFPEWEQLLVQAAKRISQEATQLPDQVVDV